MNLLAATPSPSPRALGDAQAAIGRAVKTQGRLISDLLDHARLVTGKVELQLAPLDLFAAAEAALDGVRAAAQAKDIAIEMAGERMESIVLGDADRIQQVLWNLFFNAVKFTPVGGRVRIVVARVGNQVHLTVSDSGRGIAADFLPHVFERFRQADGSSRRSQPGLGLGLTLVRELVELHGGTVHAASAGENLGATFTIVLPVPALLLVPAWSEAEPRRNVLDRTRVLVVDDEADVRNALVGLLERHGAEVRPAGSVAEAMAALASGVPHVMVSDLGMPGEDGYELIRRVRLLPPDAGGNLPSLALTAYVTDEHRAKVKASGFQHYLQKPVAPDELVAEVARLAAAARSLGSSL
jgi:CheY-like chemotaxis protein